MFSDQCNIVLYIIFIVYDKWGILWDSVMKYCVLLQGLPSDKMELLHGAFILNCLRMSLCLDALLKAPSRHFINDTIKVTDGLLIKMSHSYSVSPTPVRSSCLATYTLWISCNIWDINQLSHLSDSGDDCAVKLALDQHLVKGLSGFKIWMILNSRWIKSAVELDLWIRFVFLFLDGWFQSQCAILVDK